MLLSATIIARDEAFHLPACLKSISDVVDEMIVVDTGSTDATVELARAAGATVAFRPWDGSFAAARNAALDLAQGTWILYIDADERLSDAGGLRQALAARDAVAGLVRFRPGQAYTCYREFRLFRNRPDIRFRGVIHETMVPDIRHVVSTEGAVVVEIPAQIDHFGYEGDQSAKHRRNLPLLRRQVEDDPERLYLWFHLGSVLEGLGDGAGAEAAWSQGIEVARRQASPAAIAVPIYAKLAFARLTRGLDASDLAGEMAERFPKDPLTAWVTANQAASSGRWADAVPLLESLAEVDAESVIHPVLSYDRRIFGEFAFHWLGLCWFHLGDSTRAERWFGRASEAAWSQGIEVARRQASPSAIAVPIYAKLAFARLTRGLDASDLAGEMAERFPEDPLTAWVTANQAASSGRWADAVPLFESLAEVDAEGVIHPVLSYDRRIFGEFAFHWLGLCWFHLGDSARAERWFGRASEAAPDVDEYRLKRQLCELRSARAGQA